VDLSEQFPKVRSSSIVGFFQVLAVLSVIVVGITFVLLVADKTETGPSLVVIGSGFSSALFCGAVWYGLDLLQDIRNVLVARVYAEEADRADKAA
jgi:hypothetical protein